MSASYDIEGVLPGEVLDELPGGTSVLVSGPPMIGKRELAIRLLAAGHDAGDGILCVTTQEDAATLLDEFEAQIPTLDRDRVGIVDCSGRDSQRTIEAIATERVSSPGDLTGISIGTAKLLEAFSNRDVEAVRHGLVSVSTLLKYLNTNTVFKFVHIYTRRIGDTDGLGVFTLDAGAHDQQTINTLTSEFDGVLELRESAESGREVRLKGFSRASRDWYDFD